MTITPKERSEKNLIKSIIIKCILEEKGAVCESTIREKLKKHNIVKDQSTINRYLHEMQRDNLIELKEQKKRV